MKSPLAITLVAMAAAALLEGAFAGRKPHAVLKSLRQPSWGPPFPLWVAIGLLYYLIFGAILYRLLGLNADWAILAIALTGAILLANGAWNYLLFRRRDLVAARRVLLPYGALVAALFLLLWMQDRTGALILVPYLLYLPFAYAWVRSLQQLNAGPMPQ